MSNFKTWYDNADIPTKSEDGTWYDLEDGIQYDPDFNYGENRKRNPVEKSTLEHRKKAKFFGGKALRGTKKQKDWAEKIRSEKLSGIDPDEAEKICTFSLFTHSKFWIENREKSSGDILKLMVQIKEIIKKYNLIAREIETLYMPYIGKLVPVQVTQESKVLYKNLELLEVEKKKLLGIKN